MVKIQRIEIEVVSLTLETKKLDSYLLNTCVLQFPLILTISQHKFRRLGLYCRGSYQEPLRYVNTSQLFEIFGL